MKLEICKNISILDYDDKVMILNPTSKKVHFCNYSASFIITHIDGKSFDELNNILDEEFCCENESMKNDTLEYLNLLIKDNIIRILDA